MSEIALLKMAHVLCLVYWLGADLGVYYSSFFVADIKRSPEIRVIAAKILFTLDLAPRICMTLMLPTGIHLAYAMGRLKVPEAFIIASWIICLAWLSMVLFLHFASRQRDLRILTRFDFGFRVSLITALIAFAAYTLYSPEKILTSWLAYKLIVFALLILCGLMIRVKLWIFAPAFKQLAGGTHSETESLEVGRSLNATRPFVYLIWFGLLLNTAWSLNLFRP